MAVDRTPILKRCRSLDMDPVVLGVNKKSRRKLTRANRKVSEYGFRNLYVKAERMPGLTGPNLMILLESRLDNVVFRMGFARTRREARQIVDHKHVLVNGKCVNIPSYRISAGDKIEIKEKSKSLQGFKNIVEANAGVVTPAWMESDVETLTGTVKELPLREQIDVPVNDTLIVELYSK